MSIMRAQLPRELHAYGDMVGNRAGLETGAPSITYQGQEGPQAGGQPRPEELIIQLQEAYKQHRAQGGQLTFEEFVEVVMSQNQNRQQAAYGGIMGADGRRQYGIGSWFQKKVMDPIKGTVKKAIDNPLATAAAVGTLANYKDIIPGDRDSTGWFGNLMRNITGGNITGKKDSGVLVGDNYPGTPPYDYEGEAYGTKSIKDYGSNENNKKSSWIRDIVGGGITSALSNPNFLIPAAGLISGAFAKEDDPGYTGQGTGLNIRDIGKIANITDEKQGQAAGLRFLPEVSARKYTPEEMISTYATTEAEDFSTPEKAAQGGRIGYDMGGDVNFDIFSDEEKAKFKSMGEKMNVPETPRVFSDEERTKFESMLSDPNFGQGEGETAWEAHGGIGGENPEFSRQVQDEIERRQSEYLKTVDANTLSQWDMDKIALQTQAEMWGRYKQNKAQGGRIGYDNGGDVEIPEQFLEDLKRRDLHKLLDDYRRWQENQERQINFGPGGMEVAQGGRIGYNSGGFSAEDLLVLKKHKYNPSEVAGWKDKGRSLLKTLKGFYTLKADGGRIGAQEGGLMSLGGNEMDLRGGGFVPIGEQEKADDVPARLSKNEFVFTADAVRAAGGGNVNKGADKMYRTMKELEGVVA